MRTKACNKCGERKPLSEFYEQARNDGGLDHACKECRKKRFREYDRKRNRTKERKQWYQQREKTPKRQELYRRLGRKS